MYIAIYADETPTLLKQLADTPEMRRLSDIGMHCGCEYANFPIYRRVRGPYSRLAHSVGVANIVWKFTKDLRQAVAGLLHDIATPVFAHTIDFLNDDHMAQESTESKTLSFIENSKTIVALLQRHHIRIEDVSDYHQYPIADNDTPMLSADRLDYTLGNGYIVHNIDLHAIQAIYADLTVAKNEYSADELCFQTMETAAKFVEMSLRNSYWFVSDEDRFSMQYLADLIRQALCANVLTMHDLYTTESNVIQKLKGHPASCERWNRFTQISKIATSEKNEPNVYCVNIPAKKRYINPLVLVDHIPKRIAEVDSTIQKSIDHFLALDFDKWVYAK